MKKSGCAFILSVLIVFFTMSAMAQQLVYPPYNTLNNYSTAEAAWDISNAQNMQPDIANFKYQPALKTSPVFDNVYFLGPYNCAGRTRALLIDRADSNLLIAGGTSGGIFRSHDKAATWQPINDQSTGLNVTCIIQSPFNTNVIYYGTGETKNSKIKSKGTGLYKSIDNGLTFVNLAATNSPDYYQINSVKHSLTDSNTIYIATTKDGAYKSEDGGNNFQKIFKTGEMLSDIECFPDGKVIITSYYKGIYVSATGDSGTFTKVTSGLPASGFSRVEVSYCDSFPDVVFAVFADSAVSYTSGLVGVYKSSDGGFTWNAVTNPTQPAYYPFADFLLSIQLKPNDSNFVFCGGDKSLYTRDGGLTWTKLPYSRVDHHIYCFDHFEDGIVFVGNDQGVSRYKITANSVFISNLNEGYSIAQIWAGSYFPSGNNCMLGIQDNFFMANFNSDSVFNGYKQYGIDGCFTLVNQQDSNVVFISGNDAQIFRCDSFFTSATPVFNLVLNNLDADSNEICDDEPWHVNPLEINLADGNQVYFATENHIYRTLNKGDLWEAISLSFDSLNTKPLVVAVSDETCPVLYAAGIGGCFLRIDSACNAVAGAEINLSASSPAWLQSKGKINALKIHPANHSIVYAAVVVDNDTVSHLFKIINANTNSPQWIDISGNLSKQFNVNWVECDPLNPDSVLFAATDYGLYYTINGGHTWTYESAVPCIPIYNMRLRSSDRKLFVFTFGRGVWIANLNNFILQSVNDFVNPSGLTAFPNPVNEALNLQWAASTNKATEIIISNSIGKVVYKKTIVAEGISSTQLNVSELSSGFHTVCLINGKTIYRTSFIKIH